MIGVGGGRGHSLALGFLERDDCEIANISCRLGGRKLRIDPQTERILDDPEAMRFFQREYRQPWVVEEVV